MPRKKNHSRNKQVKRFLVGILSLCVVLPCAASVPLLILIYEIPPQNKYQYHPVTEIENVRGCHLGDVQQIDMYYHTDDDYEQVILHYQSSGLATITESESSTITAYPRHAYVIDDAENYYMDYQKFSGFCEVDDTVCVGIEIVDAQKVTADDFLKPSCVGSGESIDFSQVLPRNGTIIIYRHWILYTH